jgi:hypothetical protein
MALFSNAPVSIAVPAFPKGFLEALQLRVEVQEGAEQGFEASSVLRCSVMFRGRGFRSVGIWGESGKGGCYLTEHGVEHVRENGEGEWVLEDRRPAVLSASLTPRSVAETIVIATRLCEQVRQLVRDAQEIVQQSQELRRTSAEIRQSPLCG